MSEPGLMSRIGSWLTRARNFTANLIFVLLVVFFLMVILTSGERVRVPEGAALVLNPTGIIVKPAYSTGMTGQSSGRGTWVTPKVCHTTMSVSSMDRFSAT